MGRTIGVISGKGGVGKTTLVANISLALHELGENIIAIDGNIGTANLSLHFGMVHFPKTLNEVLEGNASLNEAVYTHTSGLRIVPSSLAIKQSGASGRKLKDFLSSLEGINIVDSSPGLHDQSMEVINACDEIILIATPEISSLTDAMKVLAVAKNQNKKIIGTVLNRVRGKKYEFSKDEVEEALGIPVIGTVPEEGKMRESAFNGIPIIIYNPHSKASIEFRRIASSIAGKEFIAPRFAWLKRILWSGSI